MGWKYLGYYEVWIYYADHALTEDEWPTIPEDAPHWQKESPPAVPDALTKIGSYRIGAKGEPSGVIKPEWLTEGNGYYYFGIVAMTTGGKYLYQNNSGEVVVLCASSDEEGVYICHTPYEIQGVEKLPKPENIRYENGQLRWSYDLELASYVTFRMNLNSKEDANLSGHGLFLYGVQRDNKNQEMYLDLTGDYVMDLQPGVTYNLLFWAQSKDYSAYADSEEILIENFLPVSEQRLPAPQNVTIDEKTLNVSWDPVDDPSVMDYVLTVYYDDGVSGPKSVGSERPQEPQVSINRFVLDKGSGTYYVTVRARTNDVTQKADGVAEPKAPGRQAGQEAWNALAHASITVSETPLPTISLADSAWGVDSYLRWAPVEGAASYEIQVFRRTSGGEPYKESYKQYTDEPAFGLSTPTPVQEEEIAVKVRAISANALQNASGEWSDFSPAFPYTAAPMLPEVTRRYNREDRTITWDPVTGEDAAYVGGYVVELRPSSNRAGWTVTTQETSLPLDAFSEYFREGVPSEKTYFSVWAYSKDLSARNHGKNNSGTGLPDGALDGLRADPQVTVTDVKRGDGDCTFRISLSGDYEGASLFAAAFESSGKLRTVRVLDAAETVPVTLTGLEKDDVIRVMLADGSSRPLAPVTPVE